MLGGEQAWGQEGGCGKSREASRKIYKETNAVRTEGLMKSPHSWSSSVILSYVHAWQTLQRCMCLELLPRPFVCMGIATDERKGLSRGCPSVSSLRLRSRSREVDERTGGVSVLADRTPLIPVAILRDRADVSGIAS